MLRDQPEPVQLFLQHTSILDRLCGPLCDAVTLSKLGQQTLESLERANLFLTALDDQREWFRYHALFGEALRYRLMRNQPHIVDDLHRRAAAWYGEHGLGHLRSNMLDALIGCRDDVDGRSFPTSMVEVNTPPQR